MNGQVVEGKEENEEAQHRDVIKKKSFTSVQGYTLHEILGKGSFGQVFKATKSGKVFAIKMIDKPLIRKKNLQKYVNNEVKVMRELKNPNTVRLYEAFEDKDVLYLVMECCNQGTLFNYILKEKPQEQECIRIFAQIMKGFIEIHEKHILHRDLKPSNIFIKDGVFKIADFGLAKPKALGSSYCGTSYFMAPEILMKQIHDYKVDLWSMGVILFFMVFREYPFKNSAKLLDEIKAKTTPVFDPYKCLKHPKNIVCSPGLLDLYSRIFVMDPKSRISFKELYRMDIVVSFFSEDELHHSSKIYLELEKKPPQQQDDEEEDGDDQVETKTKISKFKPTEQIIPSPKQQIQDAPAHHTVSLGVIADKEPPPKAEDIEKEQQKAHPHNIHHHTTGGLNQSQQKETIKSASKINKPEEEIPQQQQAQYNEIKVSITNGFVHVHDHDGRFEDENDYQGINDDEAPQIKIKSMPMCRQSQRQINRTFGPKAFRDLGIIPRSKKRGEDEETSVPNAPSSFNTFGLSHNSLNTKVKEMETGTHTPKSGNINTSQQFSFNSTNFNTMKKTNPMPDTFNNVTELSDEESDHNEDGEAKEQKQPNKAGPVKQITSKQLKLSQQQKIQPISFPEKEEVSKEENMKKMPIRKAASIHMNMVDSAVKDKLRKQIIEECEAVFESHVQVYLYEIGIYSILGDTIDSLNVLNLGSSTQSLVNYLLAKLLLFFANKLVNSLQNQQNIFKLQMFEQFTTSSPSKLLIGKISRDIEQWGMKFSLFYYGIDYDRDIQSDEVRQIVTEELVETDFDKELKVPTRLVLDLIFKASYKMGRSCTSQLQASGILRTSLYILLSMLINSAFDKNKVKENLYFYFKDPHNQTANQLDFNNFNIWTAQASKEVLLDQIHHLIKTVFGEKKLAILKTKA